MDPMTMAAMGMGIFQMGQGIVDKIKAKDMAAKNVFVPRRTAQGITDNLNLAESRASQGLSEGATSAYRQNADRGLSASIDAVLRGGTGDNMLGELNDNYNQGISRLALAEDEARVRNLDTYMKASYTNAQEDTTNWEVNSYAQWANKAQAAATLSQQGTQNISGGANTAFGAFAAYKQGLLAPKEGTTTATRSLTPTTVSPGTYMISSTPPAFNVSPKAAINLAALNLKPLTTNFPTNDNGPQIAPDWQTSERPYSNPFMWQGIH